MRIGLINASGTKFQMNGAAYGKGIYLSPQSNVSFGYCNRSHIGQAAAAKKAVRRLNAFPFLSLNIYMREERKARFQSVLEKFATVVYCLV